LPLRELADLRQGDVVQLDTGKDDPAIVFLGNQPKFLGRPGLDGKRRAVMIQRAIGADEEETYL
jgi:flagellar motor switch protein FliM